MNMDFPTIVKLLALARTENVDMKGGGEFTVFTAGSKTSPVAVRAKLPLPTNVEGSAALSDLALIKASVSSLTLSESNITWAEGRSRGSIPMSSVFSKMSLKNTVEKPLSKDAVRFLVDYGGLLKVNSPSLSAIPATIASTKDGICMGVAYDFIAVAVSSTKKLNVESELAALDPETFNTVVTALGLLEKAKVYLSKDAVVIENATVSVYVTPLAVSSRAQLSDMLAWWKWSGEKIEMSLWKEAMPVLSSKAEVLEIIGKDKSSLLKTVDDRGVELVFKMPPLIASGSSFRFNRSVFAEAIKRIKSDTVRVSMADNGLDLMFLTDDIYVFQRVGMLQ